ncbi:MAG TPA: glycosyltransferase family 2 protein [Acidimicrobiales bacterium]
MTADVPRGVHLGVVVVNFGSSSLLARNLAGIDWPAAPSATVTVVDNWSSAAERHTVTELAQRHGWELVGNDANLGFGAGVNRGAARALDRGCTHLLLVNPDVTIDAGSLSRLVAFSVDHPKTLVAPMIDRPDGTAWFVDGRLDRRTGLTRSTQGGEQHGPDRWLSGACLVTDREAWDLVGGFDERYFLYWEDIDLSWRLLERGGELAVVPDVRVTHSVRATQHRRGRSARYGFHMCRNRLRFAAFHLPRDDRLRWVRYAPAYMRRAVLGGWRAGLRHPWLTAHAVAGTVAGLGAVAASFTPGSSPPRTGPS